MNRTIDQTSPASASLPRRLCSFTAIGLLLAFIYGALPLLTDSVDILQRMSLVLNEQDIDPSRYYYSDVAQVRESELYLRSALGKD
jgi:hypothetical protein